MIGERLKIIRKGKCLSQKAFAEPLSTSASYISEIEKGKKVPGGDLLAALKRIYNVDINWLLTGSGDSEDTPAVSVKNPGRVVELIEAMLVDMSEEAQRDVLKYAEEKKLLTELLFQKKKGDRTGYGR